MRRIHFAATMGRLATWLGVAACAAAPMTAALGGATDPAENPAPLAGIPMASPMEAEMPELDRITRFFQNETNQRRIPGAVVMIARHGTVIYNEAFGLGDPATKAPMRTDSIFRIYSMTKPVTGVAVLMLLEQGRIHLSDPVSKYLPALKSPHVAVETIDADGRQVVSVVPATREITIED